MLIEVLLFVRMKFSSFSYAGTSLATTFSVRPFAVTDQVSDFSPKSFGHAHAEDAD